jgi:hypothetical protein
MLLLSQQPSQLQMLFSVLITQLPFTLILQASSQLQELYDDHQFAFIFP